MTGAPEDLAVLETLVAPEVLEPGRRQLRVSDRVLDVLVPEVGLQTACIHASVGQLISAGVPEHVRVNPKIKPSSNTQACDHLAKASRRKRRATLRCEDEWRLRVLLAPE